MTSREARLLRLVKLREQEHLLAKDSLRRANLASAVVEAEGVEVRVELRRARAAAPEALCDLDHEGWLHACAAVEFSSRRIAAQAAALMTAERHVSACILREGEARRDRKQIETVFQHAQKTRKTKQDRTEQMNLDEMARTLRTHSLGWPIQSSTG